MTKKTEGAVATYAVVVTGTFRNGSKFRMLVDFGDYGPDIYRWRDTIKRMARERGIELSAEMMSVFSQEYGRKAVENMIERKIFRERKRTRA